MKRRRRQKLLRLQARNARRAQNQLQLTQGDSSQPLTGMDKINQLQRRYGSARFCNLQHVRKQFYSFVKYPMGGANTINFFGDAISGVFNRQLTNMPKQNSFGNVFFTLKAIRCKYLLFNMNPLAFVGTDASTLYTEIVNGVFQAGLFEFKVQNKTYVQMPQPFLEMPPADGRTFELNTAAFSGTLTATAPITFSAGFTQIPFAELMTKSENSYMIDPQVMIEPEQNFEVTISYPSGPIPISATTLISDPANPLYLGVEFDGVESRPVQ